jgi:hypothetical protein
MVKKLSGNSSYPDQWTSNTDIKKIKRANSKRE